MPLTWAGGPKPATESWVVEHADRSGGPSIVGTEQIVSSGSSRIRAKLTFELFREETLWMRSLITALRGRSGTVEVGPFDMTNAPHAGNEDAWAITLGIVNHEVGPADLSTGLSATMSAPAELRDNVVQIVMPGARRPVRGQYIGIGSRLHIITEVVTTSPMDAGYVTGFAIRIEPSLRADASVGTLVNFTSPTCFMRLASPVDSLSVDANYVTSVALDLVEAV